MGKKAEKTAETEEEKNGKKEKVERFLQSGKIQTRIDGLDKLFYEAGLQLPTFDNWPLTIVIHGGRGVSKSLLAMQLLHGITKSIRKLMRNSEFFSDLVMPIFIGGKTIENMKDMFLDYIISKSIKQITEDKITGNKGWTDNNFAFMFFEKEECDKYFDKKNYSIDDLISKGIIKYNSQKNSLEMTFKNHEKEFIANRRKIDIKELNTKNKFIDDESDLNDEFFPVRILSEHKPGTVDKYKYIPCIVTKGQKFYDNLEKVIREEGLHVMVIINVIDETENATLLDSDIEIEMRSFEEPEEKYFINQIRISRCILQTAALGWHRYKKRDYGIEVYPSIHVLLQQINHMPQSLLQSSYGMLCKTDDVLPKSKEGKCVPSQEDLNSNKWKSLELLYDSFRSNLNVNKILNDLFINPSSYGKCTAIIGTPNTYKRFFAMGAAFSGCLHREPIQETSLDEINNKNINSCQFSKTKY